MNIIKRNKDDNVLKKIIKNIAIGVDITLHTGLLSAGSKAERNYIKMQRKKGNY